MKFFGSGKKGEISKGIQEHINARTGLENLSRRDFIKQTGAIGAAVALGGTGILTSSDVNARQTLANVEHWDPPDFSKLPPGIANCRDYWLKVVYGNVTGLWSHHAGYQDYKRVQGSIGILSEEIKESSKYIEPAFYLLNEQGGFFDERTDIPNLLERNPALYYFSDGIDDYFDRWIRRKPHHKRDGDAETNLVYSLYNAAYESVNIANPKAEEFLKSDLNQRAVLAKDLMTRFKKMKGADKESTDPNNAYNRRLVAAWASFLLTTHYDLLYGKNSSEGNIIYSFLEKPLRNIMFKIRGPPYYTKISGI